VLAASLAKKQQGFDSSRIRPAVFMDVAGSWASGSKKTKPTLRALFESFYGYCFPSSRATKPRRNDLFWRWCGDGPKERIRQTLTRGTARHLRTTKQT